MMKLDNTVINEIRNKVDIIDVISHYIPLVTRGKNYFCVCPFHDDHAPSMSISKEKQIYTCFSCGATGNVFNFLQNYEHISFIEAVKKCADICGIELNIDIPGDDVTNQKNGELYEIYDISQKFYQNNINSSQGKEAKEYLYSRQLTDNEIKKFEIGLSLNEYDLLTKLLQQKKYSDKDLIKSGLVNANENNIYDIYRNRIMFPLHDTNGRVIGYNGRAYRGEDTNKYVNSKETEIFKKRDFIYNYHRAKDVARDKKQIIVMEGPMDVIRASVIGIDNVVATLGTSFSSAHSNLIKRLTNNVILCFDGDAAGLKGTKLAIEELQKVGINPKIVRLPENLDPDEFIKKYGKEKFEDYLSNAYNVLEFKEILLKQDINLNNAEDVSKYIKLMIKEINSIDDEILRELTINKLCEETKISKDIILSKIEKKEIEEFEIPRKVIPKMDKYKKSVKGLLYYMLVDTKVIELYDKKITHIEDDGLRHLGFEISAFYNKNGYIDIADLITEIRSDNETIKVIGDISALNLSTENIEEAVNDYLENIKDYNELKKLDKFKNDFSIAQSLEDKIAYANKLREYKLRSEEDA